MESHTKISKTKITQYLLAIVIVLVIINFFQLNALSKKCNGITGSAVAVPTDNPTEVITIFEFSEFQCPFCKRGAATIDEVKETYGDKVEVIFKHFPLDSMHPNARKAAEAAECARDQGKFWEMHDTLFANREALDVDSLKKYAGDLELDTDTFNNCLDSGEKASIIQADFSEGQSKGVSGVPAFFIGDEMISGAQPFSAFKAIIDSELAE